MKKIFTIVFLIFTLNPLPAISRSWQEMMDDLITAPYGQSQDSLLDAIVKAKPDYKAVIEYIENFPYPASETGIAVLKKNLCLDGVERPYVIYIPSTYNPKTPTPLLVGLHGSVNRPQLMAEPLDWVAKSLFKKMAENNGWIVLFPLGQTKATWWDNIGMNNILSQIRLTKREYSIDDDRVWMIGFSDGGSAAFLFAMVASTDFAAFAALNGHMGVGSIDGNQPLYACNLSNSPIYATATDNDQLYPPSQMEKAIAMATSAGADIYYRQLPGKHDINAIISELPSIAEFFKRHPRDPFPYQIEWETAVKSFGLCNWLWVEDIGDSEPADWHQDYNAVIVDSSVSIGILPDENFAGHGVAVAGLANGDYLAGRIGLRAGDIILKANGISIVNMDSLAIFKNFCSRGSNVKMEIQRDSEKLTLIGNFPEPYRYFVFKREIPSAKAIASFGANSVNIKTSRTAALRLYIHPDMFLLDRDIKIVVDDSTCFDGKIEPDLRFIMENYLKHRDRKLLYLNQLRLDLQ